MIRYDVRKLVDARLEKGWSQIRVARISGLAPATVHRVERGLFQKPETVLRIAQALGVPMRELLLR